MGIWLVGGALEHGWIMTFQKQLGISSSQLTNSIIFQRDWNHQPDKNSYKLCLGQCWNLSLPFLSLVIPGLSNCHGYSSERSVKLSGSKNIQVEYVEYHLNPPFWQPPSQYHKWFSHVFAITPAVLWIPLDLPGTWWCGWKPRTASCRCST